MSKEDKIEIQELLNDLLDEQASERQKTEFKRLIQHDAAFAEQLRTMQRQKELLNAMPVETAPDTLVDDVRSVLERKMILGDVSSGNERTIVGTGHLWVRRILTTAAMLLLPLGLLSFVVYEIMKPPAGSGGYVSTQTTLTQGDPDASTLALASDKEMPFNGILVFRTNQQATVSNYVWKMVVDQGLINLTVPNRTADTMSYQLVAPPEKIAVLIDSLEGVWPHCQEAMLSVADGGPDNKRVDIPDIQPKQVKTLVIEDSRDMYNVLAVQYASANQNRESTFAKNDTPAPAPLPDVNPPLTMPILTGTNEPVPETVDPSQPTVWLQIRIERMPEPTPEQ